MDTPTGAKLTPKKRTKQMSMLDFYKSNSCSDNGGDSSKSSQQRIENNKRKDSQADSSSNIGKKKALKKDSREKMEHSDDPESSTISAAKWSHQDAFPNPKNIFSAKWSHQDAKNNNKMLVAGEDELCPDDAIDVTPGSSKNINSSDKNENKATHEKPNLPAGYSEWLKKSVERWSLQPPYSLHTSDAWKKYYQERAALDWRSHEIWQENGEDCPGKGGEWYDPTKMPAWSLEWKQPRMKPCCAESYAESCDSTDREEYGELVDHIRRRVEATIAKCSRIPAPMAKAAAGGAYVLQYWINREECSKDADPRTCHFETRFYVPIGTGDSYDLHYRWHYRARSYGSEKFSDLYAGERTIYDCNPEDPTPIGEWYPAKCARSKGLNASMHKLLNQDGEKKATRCTHGVLKGVGKRVLGDGKVSMSGRKVWELMARAGGMCAAGEGGNYFVEAKEKLGKLAKGEESDEEEAAKRGPMDCTIS